jgi:hypothetical protein
MLQTEVVEKMTTHILFPIIPPPKHGLCEIMWENMGDTDRPQMTI